MVSLFQKSLEKHLELFNRLICVERDVEIACLEIVESLDSDGKSNVLWQWRLGC